MVKLFESGNVQKVEIQLLCPFPGMSGNGVRICHAFRPFHLHCVLLQCLRAFSCTSQKLCSSGGECICFSLFMFCLSMLCLSSYLATYSFCHPPSGKFSVTNSQVFIFYLVYQSHSILLSQYVNHKVTLETGSSFPCVVCVPHFQAFR